MKRERKHYQITLVLLLATVFMTSCLMCLFVRQAYLDKEKAVIGELYRIDSKLAKTYAEAMFENDISRENVMSGEQAMNVFGYTEKGFAYLEKNMKLDKMIGAIGIQLALIIVVYIVILMVMREQRAYKSGLVCRIKLAIEQNALFSKVYDDEATNLLENQMDELIEKVFVTVRYGEKRNQQMQQFVENIAHQVKTPLSGIYIALELIQERVHETFILEKMEECFYQLDKIKGLLKQLLDIGRLEAGKIVFSKEAVLLDELVEEIIQTIPGGNDRIQIEKDSSKDNLYEYHCDYDWMREAMTNIVNNSLEHTSGMDNIKIQLESKREYIAIHIQDAGEGISESDLPFIFDRFYLPEHCKTSHTGIGLNLAKLVVEGHQGQIYAGNSEEGGAVFHIILPRYMLKR